MTAVCLLSKQSLCPVELPITKTCPAAKEKEISFLQERSRSAGEDSVYGNCRQGHGQISLSGVKCLASVGSSSRFKVFFFFFF